MGLLDRIRAVQAQGEGTDATTTSGRAVADVDTTPAPTRPRQEWGKPGRCPQCGGRGYLDHIDLIDRLMYQHCTECRHEWVVTEAELAAQS